MTPVDLDELETKARAALTTEGPEGERGFWWIENEEIVEGFEGTVAKCERYEITSHIAAASPAAVIELVRRVRAAESRSR